MLSLSALLAHEERGGKGNDEEDQITITSSQLIPSFTWRDHDKCRTAGTLSGEQSWT